MFGFLFVSSTNSKIIFEYSQFNQLISQATFILLYMFYFLLRVLRVPYQVLIGFLEHFFSNESKSTVDHYKNTRPITLKPSLGGMQKSGLSGTVSNPP
jgi:hypothetical protein